MGGCAARARTHSGLAPFPSEESAYDEYENDPGITAIALYDYQAGERGPGPGRAGAGRASPRVPCHSYLKNLTFGALIPFKKNNLLRSNF